MNFEIQIRKRLTGFGVDYVGMENTWKDTQKLSKVQVGQVLKMMYKV